MTGIIAGSLTKQKEITKEGPDITGETVPEVSVTQNSASGVVSQSTSVRSRYESGTGKKKKKPRGLTVSFITDENSPCSKTEGRGKGIGGGVGLGSKRQSGETSFSEEKERGERLISALNLSRFGALEHSSKFDKFTPVRTYVYTHDQLYSTYLCPAFRHRSRWCKMSIYFPFHLELLVK